MILTQSYRPGPVKPQYLRPLAKSFVHCGKANGDEVPIRECLGCSHCGRLTLTTVDCSHTREDDTVLCREVPNVRQ